MVKGTIRVSKLFSWSRSFDVDKDENVLKFIYYPDENTELHIQPTEESVKVLKGLRDQILAFMDAQVELEGTVVERWEKQTVTIEAKEVEKFVQTYP